MNPFESLPDETIYSMCSNMDTPSLNRLAQSYSRVYQVCSDIINKRHKNYEISKEDEIRTIEDLIRNLPYTEKIEFRKKLLDSEVDIAMLNNLRSEILINQTITGNKENIKLIPWILSGKPQYGSTKSRIRSMYINDYDNERIKELAKNLAYQNYKRI